MLDIDDVLRFVEWDHLHNNTLFTLLGVVLRQR